MRIKLTFKQQTWGKERSHFYGFCICCKLRNRKFRFYIETFENYWVFFLILHTLFRNVFLCTGFLNILDHVLRFEKMLQKTILVQNSFE